MSHISKAFVEVSSVEKMRELYVDIKRVYGRPCDNLLYSPNGNVVVFNETEVWSMFSKYPNAEHFINCNHYANEDEDLAVKLFLALAEMRDDTNIGRWYSICYKTYDGYGYDYVRSRVVNMADYIIGNHAANSGIWNNYSKLTPLELAEAVMRGDVKL